MTLLRLSQQPEPLRHHTSQGKFRILQRRITSHTPPYKVSVMGVPESAPVDFQDGADVQPITMKLRRQNCVLTLPIALL